MTILSSSSGLKKKKNQPKAQACANSHSGEHACEASRSTVWEQPRKYAATCTHASTKTRTESCADSPQREADAKRLMAARGGPAVTDQIPASIKPARKQRRCVRARVIAKALSVIVQHSRSIRRAHRRPRRANPAQDSVISRILFFSFSFLFCCWIVPSLGSKWSGDGACVCPHVRSRISDVWRDLLGWTPPLVQPRAHCCCCCCCCCVAISKSLHGELCAGGRSDFQLVMMMMRKDITWLHWFHNHAALWGLNPVRIYLFIYLFWKCASLKCQTAEQDTVLYYIMLFMLNATCWTNI